jgi:hypothetical protein
MITCATLHSKEPLTNVLSLSDVTLFQAHRGILCYAYYHHHTPVTRSAGRRGVKADASPHRALHWSLHSATRSNVETLRPVHSLILSTQVFLCPPLLRKPLTVPCKIVFGKESCRVTCPYQTSLRRFTTDISCSCFSCIHIYFVPHIYPYFPLTNS